MKKPDLITEIHKNFTLFIDKKKITDINQLNMFDIIKLSQNISNKAIKLELSTEVLKTIIIEKFYLLTIIMLISIIDKEEYRIESAEVYNNFVALIAKLISMPRNIIQKKSLLPSKFLASHSYRNVYNSLYKTMYKSGHYDYFRKIDCIISHTEGFWFKIQGMFTKNKFSLIDSFFSKIVKSQWYYKYIMDAGLPFECRLAAWLKSIGLTFTAKELMDIVHMTNLPKYERILEELIIESYSSDQSLLPLAILFYFSIKNNSRYHLIKQEDPKSYILESSSREEKYLIYLINNEECIYRKVNKNNTPQEVVYNFSKEKVFEELYKKYPPQEVFYNFSKEKVSEELYKKYPEDLVNQYEEEFIKYNKEIKRLKFKEIKKEIHANFNKILELHDMDYIEYLKEKESITSAEEACFVARNYSDAMFLVEQDIEQRGSLAGKIKQVVSLSDTKVKFLLTKDISLGESLDILNKEYGVKEMREIVDVIHKIVYNEKQQSRSDTVNKETPIEQWKIKDMLKNETLSTLSDIFKKIMKKGTPIPIGQWKIKDILKKIINKEYDANDRRITQLELLMYELINSNDESHNL